ncbi:MAG: hypothetical protein WDN49_06895 [Acetobacteraceae bacterium]
MSPDNWTHDQPLLDRPGNADIQMDVMYDYRNNVPLYPKVQAWLRTSNRRRSSSGARTISFSPSPVHILISGT